MTYSKENYLKTKIRLFQTLINTHNSSIIDLPIFYRLIDRIKSVFNKELQNVFIQNIKNRVYLLNGDENLSLSQMLMFIMKNSSIKECYKLLEDNIANCLNLMTYRMRNTKITFEDDEIEEWR